MRSRLMLSASTRNEVPLTLATSSTGPDALPATSASGFAGSTASKPHAHDDASSDSERLNTGTGAPAQGGFSVPFAVSVAPAGASEEANR